MFGYLLWLLGAIGLFLSVLTWNVIHFSPPINNSTSLNIPNTQTLGDQNAIIGRLSKIIQFPTVNYENDLSHFEDMIQWIDESFPFLNNHCKKVTRVSKGLLYKCGQETKGGAIVLTSHLDVVPVNPDKWTYPPFSGQIVQHGNQTYVYGRGTLDDKTGVIAAIEALQHLYLNNQFQDRQSRPVYLAIGLDEEIGGNLGAKEITDYFINQNIKVDFLLDEGGIITDSLAQVSRPIALVAVAEKGDLTLQLTAHSSPGHSSMPPPIHKSAIGMISEAITKLNKSPVPSNFKTGLAMKMFRNVMPHADSFFTRLLMANVDFFAPIIEHVLSKNPKTNALLRSTIAPTILRSGSKINVMPDTADAYINFRLAPGDSVQFIIDHVKKTIENPNIEVRVPQKRVDSTQEDYTPQLASAVSCTDCRAFEILQTTIRQNFPETIVTPYLFIAGSDSKHYRRLSNASFGFIPYRMMEITNDMERIHGYDERISVNNYMEVITYYSTLIEALNKYL